MTDTKHSPGPFDMVRGHSIIQIKSQGQPICAVGSVACHEDYTETDEANAHLFLAAPDMLAVLETYPGKDHRDRYQWHVRMMAAIAKAKGES